MFNNADELEILSYSLNDYEISGLPAKSLIVTANNSSDVHVTGYIIFTYNAALSEVLIISLTIPKDEIHSSKYFNRIIETAKLVEAEQPTESDTPTTPTSGIRPEFQEAMDSYEEFFDKYVEFMKKYIDSGYPISMLSDYTELMSQYVETMEAMEKLGEEEMSSEEAAYYLEVTTRINKKLLDVLY